MGQTDVPDDRQKRAVLSELSRHSGRGPGGGRPPQVLERALRVFGGEQELLLAAHYRWQVHLLARLDQVLELGTGDVHDDVLRAVAQLGRDLPGLAALLGEHAEDPVLAPARRRLAAYVDQACPCGRPHPLVLSAHARPKAECLARGVARRCRRRLTRVVARAACTMSTAHTTV